MLRVLTVIGTGMIKIAVAIVGIGVVNRLQSNRNDAQRATVALVGEAPADLAAATAAAGKAVGVDVTFVPEADRATALAAMVAGTGIALYTGVMYWLALGPAFVIGWLGLRTLRGLYFLLLLTIPLSAEVQLTERLGTDLPIEKCPDQTIFARATRSLRLNFLRRWT